MKRKIGKMEEPNPKRIRLATKDIMPCLMKSLAEKISFLKEVVDSWDTDQCISFLMKKVDKYKGDGLVQYDAVNLALKKRKPKFKRLFEDGIRELFQCDDEQEEEESGEEKEEEVEEQEEEEELE